MARLESEKNYSGKGFQTNAIKKAFIENFTIELEKFKDVYWVVEFLPEDSQFTEKVWIVGDFEKGTDGTIKANWLIDKVNNFLDLIGYSGGFNIRGEFETPEGVKVPFPEIEETIKTFMVTEGNRDCYAYFYKEWNEKDGKAYSRVLFPPVRLDQKERLMNTVKRLLEKGQKRQRGGIIPYIPEEEDTPKTNNSYSVPGKIGRL